MRDRLTSNSMQFPIGKHVLGVDVVPREPSRIELGVDAGAVSQEHQVGAATSVGNDLWKACAPVHETQDATLTGPRGVQDSTFRQMLELYRRGFLQIVPGGWYQVLRPRDDGAARSI